MARSQASKRQVSSRAITATWTGALGVNGPLYGATWNVEVLPTSVRDGPTIVSALANVSDAQTLFGRNARLFAEYFHNGFGVEGDVTAATLPSYLKTALRADNCSTYGRTISRLEFHSNGRRW